MSEEEYKPTYWSGKGKYQKEHDRLYKKLVPRSGKSKSTYGELLRCISRFYYEKYNNGFCNDKSYEIEYVNSFRWDENLDIEISEKMSDKELDETVDKIVEFLLEKEKEGKI